MSIFAVFRLRQSLSVFALVFSLTIMVASAAYADSPPNITTDIPWTDTGGVFDIGAQIFDATFNGPTDIEAAFNNGRRQEESQLGLPANFLGDLNLPTNYNSLSDDEKALYIINDERTARVGEGDEDVIGLPLERTDTSLNAVAQAYANLLVEQNTTGHNNNSGPSGRLNGAFGDYTNATSCREFMARTENLAYFWTSGSSIPLALERSIYAWIYDDASSNWGHREAALLQDNDLNGNAWGYTNNTGSAASEGYLGIGVASSTSYNNGFGWANYGVAVTMNIIDPDPVCTKPNDDMGAAINSFDYNGSSGDAALGTLTINFDFTNNGSKTLSDLFFIFTNVSNAIIVNADNTPGGTGLSGRLSVANASLPSNDNEFDPTETLPVAFQIGIESTPWKVNFDMWAVDTSVNAAALGEPEQLYKHTVTLDSSMFDLASRQVEPVLFLPLIGQ
ncbi:MAG: hypothetical protein AAF702_23945 [Chloroflexota bacterium]